MWIVPAIVATILALGHIVPFPFVLDWANRDVAMWKAPAPDDRMAGRPRVYLTFDDGPNPAATPQLLDALARHKVRATFFMIGQHVTPETAGLVRRAADEGHGIALHADNRALVTMRDDEVRRALDAAETHVEALSGVRPCPAFRPHAGARSSSMMSGLRRSGRRLIGWGFFLWDWDFFRAPNPERLASRISRRAGPGSIVVLHDGDNKELRPDRLYVVRTVDALVPRLREKGFEFGNICDVVDD